jgi:hypothetical protein
MRQLEKKVLEQELSFAIVEKRLLIGLLQPSYENKKREGRDSIIGFNTSSRVEVNTL